MEVASRARLEALGLVDDVLGQVLLMMATAMDDPATPPNALVALARESRALWRAVEGQAPRASDAVDELSARRRHRKATT